MNVSDLLLFSFVVTMTLSAIPTDYFEFTEFYLECKIKYLEEHQHLHNYPGLRKVTCYVQSFVDIPGYFNYQRAYKYHTCFMTCIAEKLGIWTNKTGFNVDNVLKQLGGIRDVVKQKVDRCIEENKNTADICNQCYDTIKCYYTDTCHGKKTITKPKMRPHLGHKQIGCPSWAVYKSTEVGRLSYRTTHRTPKIDYRKLLG